jgi:UDP-2-acetamido-3-amino-2,3-dideoxy-glucuronate N-acetyltransferase
LIRLHAVPHACGELVVGERGALPFEPRRSYFVHGIPDGARRGGHAHRRCEEAIVAIRGAFRVTVERPGDAPAEFALTEPTEALYVPPGCWLSLWAFTADAAFLVFASLPYSEADYIRDRGEFERLAVAPQESVGL